MQTRPLCWVRSPPPPSRTRTTCASSTRSGCRHPRAGTCCASSRIRALLHRAVMTSWPSPMPYVKPVAPPNLCQTGRPRCVSSDPPPNEHRVIDPRLQVVVKAYDVRGLSPQQLDPEMTYALGM